MKKILILLYIILFAIVLQAQETKDIDVSTYYLIRHAEKLRSKNPDMALHSSGKKRAKAWVEIFKDISFDAVYSTDYIRTRNTVLPTAESKGLELTTYDPNTIDYAKFLAETKGKTVLIVGHSNTIPKFVNKLIGKEKYKKIDPTRNGNLYIAEITDHSITDKVLYLK